MDKSTQDFYANQIKQLSQSQFEELVVEYLKSRYKTTDIHFCDGPYDGGRDVIINVPDKGQIKRHFQITIQESNIENKIRKELKNAQTGGISDLDFYYKHSITPVKQEKLKEDAEIQNGIRIDFFDNKRLGALMGEHPAMRDLLRKIIDAALPNGEASIIDDKTKILYDTLSMNSNITELKKNFVVSYIEHQLFIDGPLTVSEIYNRVNPLFRDKFEKGFYETLVGQLKKDDKIVDIPNHTPKKFELAQDVRGRLDGIVESAKLSEKDLAVTCETICKKHNVSLSRDELIKHIIKLFDENYAIDITEITEGVSNEHKSSMKSIYSNLISFIVKKANISEEDAQMLAKDLIDGCAKNNLINKSSISKMFVSLFEDDKLDRYLNKTERNVFLDTQILLQLLCVYHGYDKEYPDFLYQHAAELINGCESSTIPIKLYTTTGYIDEVVHQILDAVKLDRFLSLSYVQSLGPSKNVFCNFYNYLIDDGADYESLKDFIADLLDIDNVNSEDEIRNAVSDVFTYSDCPIEIKHHPRYESDVWLKYKREYENFLSYSHYDKKSPRARNNDLCLVLLLSKEMDASEMEPYFITWDTSFYKLRDRFSKLQELSRWYLYSPQKFANTLSVINMKIDPKTVNYNIISLVEENFNASNDTISFLDQLNVFFEGEDLSKSRLARRFGKLREDLLKANQTDKITKGNLPIDEFMLLLSDSFSKQQGANVFTDLKGLFNDNEYADAIVNILKAHMDSFKTSELKLKSEIVEEFNTLINQRKQMQSNTTLS